jgi:hypothetical protein
VCLKFNKPDAAGLSDWSGEDFDAGDLTARPKQGAKIVVLGFVRKIVDKKSARLQSLCGIRHERLNQFSGQVSKSG